jgi:hypothetical protein
VEVEVPLDVMQAVVVAQVVLDILQLRAVRQVLQLYH